MRAICCQTIHGQGSYHIARELSKTNGGPEAPMKLRKLDPHWLRIEGYIIKIHRFIPGLQINWRFAIKCQFLTENYLFLLLWVEFEQVYPRADMRNSWLIVFPIDFCPACNISIRGAEGSNFPHHCVLPQGYTLFPLLLTKLHCLTWSYKFQG